MTEQSNFSQLTDEGVESDTGEAATDDSTPGSSDSASDGSRSTLTEHIDPTVESWVSERENQNENYGYFHLYVVAKSDLTGVERQLRYVGKLDLTVPEDDTSRQYGGRWGQGGVRVDEVRGTLIDWKLEELATPYHPDLRTVSAGNLRIFVAEPARDYLRDDVEIDALVGSSAFEELTCPVCGSAGWTHLVFQGVFCDQCNTRCLLRETAGDQGFIAEFDGTYTWAVEDAEGIPETEEYGALASGKWLGSERSGYERYWFSARAEYDDSYDGDWQPAWERTEAENDSPTYLVELPSKEAGV